MEQMENDVMLYEKAEIGEPAISPSEVLSAMSQLFGYAREAKITEREVSRYRNMRDVAITNIMTNYQFAREQLHMTFAERRRIIEKDFEIIDKGMATNDYTLINTGLQHISVVIKENPFKIFQITTPAQRFKMLEDGDLFDE